MTEKFLIEYRYDNPFKILKWERTDFFKTILEAPRTVLFDSAGYADDYRFESLDGQGVFFLKPIEGLMSYDIEFNSYSYVEPDNIRDSVTLKIDMNNRGEEIPFNSLTMSNIQHYPNQQRNWAASALRTYTQGVSDPLSINGITSILHNGGQDLNNLWVKILIRGTKIS